MKANPETAQRVVAGFVEGIHYYKTNPAAGVAALQSRGVDPQAARDLSEDWWKSFMGKRARQLNN